MLGKIYTVKNLANIVLYVGQTTQSLEARAAQHKCTDSLLGRKLRKEQLIFEVIKAVPISELNAWECFFIGKYDTLYPTGLNLQLPISSARMTEEIKQKIRKSKSKGKIYSIDLSGHITEFLSIKQASVKLNINLAHVWEALNGKRYAAGGHAFWKEGQSAKTTSDIRNRVSTGLFVVDESTQQTYTFPSGYKCGKVLGIDSATVLRGLKEKEEVKYKNYRIRRIK